MDLVVVRTIVAAMIVMMVLARCVNSAVSLATLLLGATNGLTVIFWVLATMAQVLHVKLL
jgi:hypothetical protein